jgi:hypothetical protein
MFEMIGDGEDGTPFFIWLTSWELMSAGLSDWSIEDFRELLSEGITRELMRKPPRGDEEGMLGEREGMVDGGVDGVTEDEVSKTLDNCRA